MSEFEDRLKAAIQRGQQRGKNEQLESANAKANLEQLRRQHTSIRLSLSEHIESVVRKMADYFPGFRYESVFGDAGWGAACWRDTLVMKDGVRQSEYSRFEMVIRPVNEFLVVDVQVKGTVANREVLSRNFYQPVAEVDVDHYRSLIDSWALMFAEMLSARSR